MQHAVQQKADSAIRLGLVQLSDDMTNQNKMSVSQVKAQIGLGIHPGRSESSLGSLWVTKDPILLLSRLNGCTLVSLGVHSYCWLCHVMAYMTVFFSDQSCQ